MQASNVARTSRERRRGRRPSTWPRRRRPPLCRVSAAPLRRAASLAQRFVRLSRLPRRASTRRALISTRFTMRSNSALASSRTSRRSTSIRPTSRRPTSTPCLRRRQRRVRGQGAPLPPHEPPRPRCAPRPPPPPPPPTPLVCSRQRRQRRSRRPPPRRSQSRQRWRRRPMCAARERSALRPTLPTPVILRLPSSLLRTPQPRRTCSARPSSAPRWASPQ